MLSLDLKNRSLKTAVRHSLVKIEDCYRTSALDVRIVSEKIVNALGFVSSMTSGPGVMTDAEIARLIEGVNGDVMTFLFKSRTIGDDIVRQLNMAGANTAQLVDRVSSHVYREIKDALSVVKILQVFHITDESAIDEALFVSIEVDYMLLDKVTPDLPVRQLRVRDQGTTGTSAGRWSTDRIPLFSLQAD